MVPAKRVAYYRVCLNLLPILVHEILAISFGKLPTALFGLHLSAEMIRQIIHHAAEGVGVRATARLLELDKDTVNRVILRAGEHCAHVLSGLLT